MKEYPDYQSACASCPHSGSIIDNHVDCPDAYKEVAQHCNLNIELLQTLNERNELLEDVKSVLEEAVEDVFAILQERQNIQCGDIEPFMALKLESLQNNLAEIITDVLNLQKKT